MALVIALGGTAVDALILAAIFLVAAGAAAGVGYALLPKHPLERTRHHVEDDIRELKEHAS